VTEIEEQAPEKKQEHRGGADHDFRIPGIAPVTVISGALRHKFHRTGLQDSVRIDGGHAADGDHFW